MKTFTVLFLAALVLGGIITVLVHNKAKSASTARNDKMTTFPVSALTVGKEKMEESLSMVGTITGNNDVAIVSETQGRVVSVFAKVGDYVAAGTPLVQVDDELRLSNYKAAEVNYEKTKKDLARNEELFKDRTISESQIEGSRLAYASAENQYIVAKRQLNDTRIKTPITGIVTARTVDFGVMVQPGMTIGNVVDISKLKVKLNVAEKDAFKLKAGDKVDITTEVYPGVTFDGRIESISSKGDEAHTYPVEITFANSAEHPLKAGMFSRVHFTSIHSNESVVIPREAIIGSIKEPKVYVIENGIAKLRSVVAGTEAGTKLQILQGLKEGEQIVVAGHNNLKDNVPVTIMQ